MFDWTKKAIKHVSSENKPHDLEHSRPITDSRIDNQLSIERALLRRAMLKNMEKLKKQIDEQGQSIRALHQAIQKNELQIRRWMTNGSSNIRSQIGPQANDSPLLEPTGLQAESRTSDSNR